jgi:DNA polymerase
MQSLIADLKNFLLYQQDLYGKAPILSQYEESEPPTPKKRPDNVPTIAQHVETQPNFIQSVEPSVEPSVAPNVVLPQTPYEHIEALIPNDSPLKGMKTLEEVRQYVAQTILIPLDKTRKNPVFGVGNEQAKLMVIGEAPGANEDAQGEPFVGEAGQLLNKILAAIGFERQDVYIANILKSRPPHNRDPLPDEIAAHIPILYKQIALIQPRIMICMGRVAGTTLLNCEATLGSLRGKFHDFHGLEVMITYHPAALLRNPQWKRPTWEDVQKLRTRYDEIVQS